MLSKLLLGHSHGRLLRCFLFYAPCLLWLSLYSCVASLVRGMAYRLQQSCTSVTHLLTDYHGTPAMSTYSPSILPLSRNETCYLTFLLGLGGTPQPSKKRLSVLIYTGSHF